MKKHNKVKNQVRTVNNGLASAVGVDMYNNASLPLEIEANANIGLLTLNWVTLVNTYKSNGFIKLAVDMPVDDAFRGGGFEFESGTLEAEELEELNEKVKELDLEAVKQVARWGRLFGGGVLLCETGQNLDTPFNPETIYNKEIEFLACDRWQCYPVAETLSLAKTFVLQDLSLKENGGIISEVDKSRLQVFTGEVQPYYIRNQLQGWGISLLECIIPQLNQYLKANRVILELLDEAKIDILKIFGLADNLMSADGESAVKRRVSIFATQKNYKNVGVMDTQDDYDQKTMQFGGIDRLLEKIFLLICSSLRIPYSKVFGRGASGFSSGEDDLENYNAMIMSNVRVPITPLLKWVGQIRACQLFGRKVDDLSVKWKSLRVLTEKEEQEIRTQKINSYLQLLQAGVINRKQVAEQLQKDDIMAFSPEDFKELENDTNFEEIEEESETVEEKKANNSIDKKKGFLSKIFNWNKENFDESKINRKANGQFGKGGTEKETNEEYKNILSRVSESNKSDLTENDIIEAVLKDKNFKYSKSELLEKVKEAEEYNKNVVITKDKYLDPATGKYTKEREEKHKEILAEIFKNKGKAKPKNGEKPKFVMLGGRGGSGKSKFNGLVYNKENYIVLDADAIKEKIEEYKGYNAWEVHEESSDILNRALKKAKKEKLNIVLDGTMKTKKSAEDKIRQLKANGYDIEMYYMHLPREISSQRALGRFMGQSGRYVPLKVLLSMKDNEKNFDELKHYAKKWAFYDNNVESKDTPPKLIEKNY